MLRKSRSILSSILWIGIRSTIKAMRWSNHLLKRFSHKLLILVSSMIYPLKYPTAEA